MEENQARISNEEVEALLEKTGKEAAGTVRPYDFAAQRINRTELPLLEEINKNFGDRAGASLAGLLGRDVSLHFDSLESVKSAELQASLPVPATIAVVRLKPLPGFAYVSVEPALLLTLLDGFFGRSGCRNAGGAGIGEARNQSAFGAIGRRARVGRRRQIYRGIRRPQRPHRLA